MYRLFLVSAVVLLLVPPMQAVFQGGVTASVGLRPFFMMGYQPPYYYDVNVAYLAVIEAVLIALAAVTRNRLKPVLEKSTTDSTHVA